MAVSIKGRLAVLAASTAMVLAAPAFAQTPAAPAKPPVALSIMQATAAIQAGKCADAAAPLAALWDDPDLQASDPDMAGQMRFQRIICVAQTSGIKAAIALSSENLKIAPVGIEAYDLHAFLLLSDNQTDAAAATLDTALTSLPADGPTLKDITVLSTVALEQRANPAGAATLMNHLEDAHWQVHAPPARIIMDDLRLTGLRAAVKVGDQTHAALYRADIAQDSLIYVLSQGDGTISDAATAPQPVGPVIGQEITAMKVFLGQNNAELPAYSALLRLESIDDQDAIAQKQAIGLVALIDQHGLAAFAGIDTYPEILAQRGELFANLGRGADALSAYQDGATRLGLGEGRGDFYMSYINYLVGSGQYTAALNIAGTIDVKTLSGGQLVEMTQALACAMAGAGDTADYAKALAVLPDHSMARIKPQLCAGDIDSAAQNLIAGINGKDSRDEAIMYLQQSLPGIPYSDKDKAYVAAAEALKRRPDVLDAAQKANIVVRAWPLRF